MKQVIIATYINSGLTKLFSVDTRNLKKFAKDLREMTPEWYPFGLALGLTMTDLNIIQEQTGLQCYMLAMLEEWMRTKGEEVTWENLQEALRNIGNRRLAGKLQDDKLDDQQG